MSAIPPELAPIKPLLARALEIQSQEPLVSYFCKLYAAKKALALEISPHVKAYLLNFMDDLDKEKSLLVRNWKAFSIDQEDKTIEYIKDFAQKLLLTADEQLASNSTPNAGVAKAFLAASCFFETLKFFLDPLPSEIEEKILYSKWKASEILKSIKNPPPSSEPSRPAPLPSSEPPRPLTISESPRPNFESLSSKINKIEEIQKLIKYSSNSLDYEDIASCKNFLLSALESLSHLE